MSEQNGRRVVVVVLDNRGLDNIPTITSGCAPKSWITRENAWATRYWVNFEGADVPSEGKYATCLPFDYVMDPTNDVILAYEIGVLQRSKDAFL